MRHRKADIERAKRHVVDAEKRVAKQRALVDELERDGYPTTEGHELLRVMVDLLDQMRTHADGSPRTQLDFDSVPPQ
jgi:hypothetical protein